MNFDTNDTPYYKTHITFAKSIRQQVFMKTGDKYELRLHEKVL